METPLISHHCNVVSIHIHLSKPVTFIYAEEQLTLYDPTHYSIYASHL